MSQIVDPEDDDLPTEYDFSHGVRGKHHEAYWAGTNVIFLEPDENARANKGPAQ
jgi:hypothetical protein